MTPILYFSFIVYFITSVFTVTPANAEDTDLNAPYSKPKYVWHVTGKKSSGQYIAEDTYKVGIIPPVVGENVRSQGGAAFGDLNMDTNEYTYVDWVGGPYHTKGALCQDMASRRPEEWLIKVGCIQTESPNVKEPSKKGNFWGGLLILAGILWLMAKCSKVEPSTPTGTQIAEGASDMPTAPASATGKYVPETITVFDKVKLSLLGVNAEKLLQIKHDINLYGQDAISTLVNEIKKNTVVGMGEVHAGDEGKGNPFRDFAAEAMPHFVKAGATHLAIESPDDRHLDTFNKTGVLKPEALPEMLRDDNYIRLLKTAKNLGLQIVTVDNGDPANPEYRNKQMAEKIGNIVKENGNAKIIFWVGSTHLRTTGKPGEYSAGYVLKTMYPDKVVSVYSDMDWKDVPSIIGHASRGVKTPIVLSPAQAKSIGDLPAGASGHHLKNFDLIITFPTRD